MDRIRPNNDLWFCLRDNTPSGFDADDVEAFIAEVPGANDELSWWWILKLKDGRYVLFSAFCDYTGWDCHSEICMEVSGDAPLSLAELSPEAEDLSGRNIRHCLILQINGHLPYGLYDSNYEKEKRDGQDV